MKENIESKIRNEINKPVLLCATKIDSTGEHCPESGIHQIDGSDDFLCDKCLKMWNNKLIKAKNDGK